MFVPAPSLLVDVGDQKLPYGRMTVTHSYSYEQHTQIKRITTYHAFPDGRLEQGSLDMRMYYPEELDALLEYNGLLIESKLGSFDLRDFDGSTGQQLIVCSLRSP